MFDAYEAVNNIIDDINESYNEACYEDIYNELCYRVECGEMSLEDAELVNEAAYDKYVTELTRERKELRDRYADNKKAKVEWAKIYNGGHPYDKDAERRAWKNIENKTTRDDRLMEQIGRGNHREASDNLDHARLMDSLVKTKYLDRGRYNLPDSVEDSKRAKKYLDKISNPNYDPEKDLWLKDKETGEYLKKNKYLKLQQAKDRATGRVR